MNRRGNLTEVAALFLRLGVTAFGGPAAHIAMMRYEVVVKRKWVSEQHFLDLIGGTNLIPGPNSTEMAIHIGHERAGWRGLIVAGLCFILPAVIITSVFAWAYRQYGQLPEVRPFVYGIKPAIISVVIAAVYPLAVKSVKSFRLALIGVMVLVMSLLNVNEIYLMFGAGFLALLMTSLEFRNRTNSLVTFTFAQIGSAPFSISSNVKLFLIFLKIGAILYGSGYVLFAFLDTELVSTGLLSRQQLIDAIAVGQFTPGPVFSAVTFVGYQLNGWTGAGIATIGIFLPSFVFVAFLNPLVKKMRSSQLFAIFLDAVNVASVAIILAVCYTMSRESIFDWRTFLIAAASMFAVFRYKRLNSTFVVIGGALTGYLLSLS